MTVDEVFNAERVVLSLEFYSRRQFFLAYTWILTHTHKGCDSDIIDFASLLDCDSDTDGIGRRFAGTIDFL